MKKSDREKIFNKYGGRCAYCGCELESDWEVDHAISRAYAVVYIPNKCVHDIENLMPACKPCNHYKREKCVSTGVLRFGCFRDYMMKFHVRFARYPKKPRDPKSIKRKAYMQSIADRYGITPQNPFNGIFYFETLTLTSPSGSTE